MGQAGGQRCLPAPRCKIRLRMFWTDLQAAEQLAVALVEWQRPPGPLDLGPLLAGSRPLEPSPLLDPRPLDPARWPPAAHPSRWIAAASPRTTTSAIWTSHS